MMRSILKWVLLIVATTYSVSHAALAIADGTTGSSNALPDERRPYDVRLLIAFDSQAIDKDGAQAIVGEIDLAARRCVGELWSFKSSRIDWLNPVTTTGLQRLDRAHLSNHDPGELADVWFAATVESLPVGVRVSVRSWQPEVQLETSMMSIDVVDHREISTSVLRMCRSLIRPMGVVEQVNEKIVRIRLRAGELIPPDPSFAQLAKGDLLSPMIANRDKNKAIEKLQSIPWTYVSVDDVDGSTVSGTVQSGLRMALGGKKRSRIDTLVVALRPQHSSTRLELWTQSKPQYPLVAHRIEVRSEPIIPRPSDENPKADPKSTLLSELLTDRRGLVNVAVVPEKQLVWLFAYSGQNLLARVPFAPGLESQVRLEVPDDATRLAAESDLQMLQGEVIDAVAFRNTMIASIRAAAKKNDWTTVNQKLGQLKQQRESGSFIERLNAVRVLGTNAAKAHKDKAAEVRINRMCDEATDLINAHLSAEKIASLVEEMDALRAAEVAPEKP